MGETSYQRGYEECGEWGGGRADASDGGASQPT